MNGAVWVPLLLLSGVVMVWATWPRRDRDVDLAEAQRQADAHRASEVEVAPGLAAIARGLPYMGQLISEQVRDEQAARRLRAVCHMGLAQSGAAPTVADQAVGDAQARWDAHVAFMRTTPWPVRRCLADFYDDVQAEIAAAQWGPEG